MRISHHRKKEEPQKIYLFNEGIVAHEVMVLDANGQNLGIMKTGAGIALAQERGLDLVEINPKSNPPVAKIIDFGQFRYTQEKEKRLQKAHQHIVDTKGVRLSLRIGGHDLEIRRLQALKFLNEGNKVKIEITLRGREMQQGQHAVQIAKEFADSIIKEMPIRWEQAVERAGNKVTAIIVKS